MAIQAMIDVLKRKGKQIAPVTVAKAVYTEEGKTVENKLKEKTEKIRIDVDVANRRFLKNGEYINFGQLNTMLQSSPDFLVFVYGKREHRCTFIDMDSNPKQMRFVAPLVNDGFLKAQSIYVTSIDGVNITNMTVSDINSENLSNKRTNLDNPNNTTYPTTKAVSDVVDEINEELSTEKQAIESLGNSKQDKLIAGQNITIAEDGRTISASGGGGSIDYFEVIDGCLNIIYEEVE